MSAQEELLELVAERRSSRRNLLRQAAASTIAMAAGGILAGCGGSGGGSPLSTTSTVQPVDVLQFALNLEYLEAQYYLYATTGAGLSAADSGTSTTTVQGDVPPTSGPVAFTNYSNIAKEIAQDELNHVRFLRSALTAAGVTPVSRPAIDLVNSFNAAASAAGIGSSFNPFSSELYFILGAFIFEDVGVTAYHGGAGYLENSPYLTPAAGILGTEAYHAGAIRTIIAETGGTAVTVANAISALRAKADGSSATGNETPVVQNGQTYIAATDTNSITYARTPQEVLNIVYLNAHPGTPVHSGGFYPAGMNGKLR